MILAGMFYPRRWKLARMRVDEPVADLGGGGAPAIEAPASDVPQPGIEQPVLDGEQTQQPDAPTDFEKLFAEPEPAKPAVVDPNAPPVAAESGAIPPAFQEALTISELVKEPAQVAQAVRAADELWRVESGQLPVHSMLEGFRARNAEGFSQILTQSLIPYIEQITGKRLMDPGAPGGGDPNVAKTPEQERLERLEHAETQREEQRQQQAHWQNVTRADAAASAKISELTKGTFLEGKEAWLLPRLGPYLGMSVKDSMAQLLKGDASSIERALKAYQDEFTPLARGWSRQMIAESRKVKGAVPGSKSNPRGGGEPDLEAMTREEKIQYLSGA